MRWFDRRYMIRIWRSILMVILLVTLPALSACDLFGGSKDKEREYYEQQLEYYKQVQEANNKAREEYRKQLQEGLEEWAKAFNEWQDKQAPQ